MSGSEIREALRDFELRELFNGLGWDNASEQQYITITDSDGTDSWYELDAVAQKRRMMVFTLVARPDESLPDAATRKKIEREVTKLYTEHFIVYASADKGEQIWQWVKRQSGAPAMVREQRFSGGNPPEKFVQRIRGISFSIEEEDTLGELDVFGRVQANFDVERLTKRFYESFKKEHDAFLAFIEGLDDMEEKQWYASIMLNRLMFVYFVQRKGFLDGNQNYLQDKLAQMRSEEVEGNFLTFYRRFLLKLFLQGLGQAEANREPEVDRLIGDIPYLNGGLFDVHSIEENNPDLDIPDEAFKRVFAFFEGYDWHLDERPLKKNNEINPDVLGYIFEKYINQKQMGAYYTQEDVTGYITQNTVIPYLFDATEKECHIAFRPDSSMWELLADNPDKYIYDAVLEGVDIPLPEDIKAGIEDVSKREKWNRAADDEYALPTETWREHVARRQRCEELREKLAGGEVKTVDALVTLNLNIRKFAGDAVIYCEGADFLRAFYKAVREVSVLDPTCGSGAFLFAALNVLKDLYGACLERMQQFVEEDTTGERYQDFRENLAEVEEHTSREYFILKSIMVRNLYGVDIMEEAVEIARLRLFLKLMAQIEERKDIEPLPDLDFNLRAGNTLVGFSSMDEVRRTLEKKLDFGGATERIESGAAAADDAFQQFRGMQMDEGADSEKFAEAKAELRKRFEDLNLELDWYLAEEYGVEYEKDVQFAAWRQSHEPFHWLIEFFGIMQSGGFNVIVGNPPYVEYSKIKDTYRIRNYETQECGNLYAPVCERSITLVSETGCCGLIIPLSGFCTERMSSLQEVYKRKANVLYLSHFSGDRNPAELFDGVKNRLTIALLRGKGNAEKVIYSTEYLKWYTRARPQLFSRLHYADVTQLTSSSTTPKVGEYVGLNILKKINEKRKSLSGYFRSQAGSFQIVHHNAPIHWMRAFTFRPYFWNERDGHKLSGQMIVRYSANKDHQKTITAIMNSSTFFYFWLAYSDCYHLVSRELSNFRVDLDNMPGTTVGQLSSVCEQLMSSYQDNSVEKAAKYKTTGTVRYQEIDPKKSKNTIDKIDSLLASYYGFTDEELDFIINYAIKYRMGVEEG